MEQFKPQKQTAILSEPPAGVEHSNVGWRGTFLVDGQRILVTPSTELLFKLTNREKKLAKRAKNSPKNNYANLDYSKFHTNEAEFRGIVERVHAASKGKRKIRVTD